MGRGGWILLRRLKDRHLYVTAAYPLHGGPGPPLCLIDPRGGGHTETTWIQEEIGLVYESSYGAV